MSPIFTALKFVV